MRTRIDLAYDGTDFKGWARQPGLRTVQEVLEESLATVLRVPSVSVTCAGRTDSGVHARGQVVHLELDEQELTASIGRSRLAPMEALRRRLNGILPPDARVHRVDAAPPGFDARYSAIWRRYAYRVTDRDVDPLTRHHVLAWPRHLDVDSMNEAADLLLGLRDFAAYCKRREGATTVRTLIDLHWERDATGLAVLTVRADAFCHNMVRALTGALLAVGDGRRTPDWPQQVLATGQRSPAVTVAPARGLTLEEVGYPDGLELVRQAERARNKRELPDD
ncbi:tRNA pseudouridine(38-40) synthase TruA [Nocardioides sp. JQ2195]|uniref:tRNA pseudouridine(38-40) synthase TruA n=1 Tax=Nocardioides sp. JQ2195 TaxID=2592334 RepID=UPI00143E8306|nr:tRNA pseudouridine(38-40) synthase TruA [Nocardioides sp. JQ2195]QIX25784.1 tRNA pseudouridine(38-40) synthase TruA [Nocardioides sp. JQ2195]